MERKLYEDIDKSINDYLENMKKTLYENLPKLPNEELPFMECHLRALYFQAHYLTAEGFYNASLVLCGILLESLVKEELFIKGVSDKELEDNMGFGGAINRAKKMNLLSDKEIAFLESKKDSLRNSYAHYNKMKLSDEFQSYVFKVPIERLKNILERTMKGETTDSQSRQELINGIEPETMTPKEFRPLAQMGKVEFENRFAIDVFLEIDKFTREFAIKHFKPKEEDKK